MTEIKKGDSGKLGAKSPLGKQILALKTTLGMSDDTFLKLIFEETEVEAQNIAEAADGITEAEQKLMIEELKGRIAAK